MTAAGPETPPERFDPAGERQPPADTASALLTTIWPLLGRHIAFHRRLVDLTGNVKAALLLSQAVYWTRHGRDIAQRDGWFHKTAEQWELPLLAVVGGGEALIFPDRLLPQERDAAQRLLSQVDSQHQALLDELAGRLQTERVRSPVAYLRGLIQRAAAGQFVPELAPRIAAERDRLQREAEARRAQDAEERRLAAERATPEYQLRERERRQRISELLSDMRRRIGTPPGR